MEFYDATEAKQYARNKTRIIKEINDIEENIAQAVDENKFSCDVYNTVMTDDREFAEPSKDALAHCIMQLASIKIHNEDNIEEDGEIENKNYFRIGEILKIKNDKNLLNPIIVKITEVNENGDIINFEILDRGEYTEIFDKAELEYQDMEKWLDIDSNYGLISDLRITRENEIQVKDLTYNSENPNEFKWFDIGKTYTLNDLPPFNFGIKTDTYIKEQNDIYIKISDELWKQRNNLYTYLNFKLPLDFGEIYCVCYNVFGQTYVKNECGWNVSPRPIIYLNHKPEHNDGLDYDIAYWTYTYTIEDQDGTIREVKESGKSFKNCNHCWVDISNEYDWLETPPKNFGEDLDVFTYPEGLYRVKIDGQWYISSNEYRFDQIYIYDDWGENHDILEYNGVLEPLTTYVKISNHWLQVQKIWNLNEYLLGRLPVNVDLLWSIKRIVLDSKGDGYMYPTQVLFSDGNASAVVELVNEKIVNIKLIYGGDDYIIVPEINFVMEIPSLSKMYFKIWKQMTEDYAMQDEMEQVIKYFEKSRKYTITRVVSENNANFHWHVSWY